MWCIKNVGEPWMTESVLNWGQHPSKDQFHHSQTSLSLSHYLLHHLAFLAGVPIQSGDMALGTTLGSFFWSIALCSPLPPQKTNPYIYQKIVEWVWSYSGQTWLLILLIISCQVVWQRWYRSSPCLSFLIYEMGRSAISHRLAVKSQSWSGLLSHYLVGKCSNNDSHW